MMLPPVIINLISRFSIGNQTKIGHPPWGSPYLSFYCGWTKQKTASASVTFLATRIETVTTSWDLTGINHLSSKGFLK